MTQNLPFPQVLGRIGPVHVTDHGPVTCITCSDEGRLGRIVAMPAGDFLPALVRTEEGDEDVDIMLVDGVSAGSYILIHAGTAIASVAEPTPDQIEVLA